MRFACKPSQIVAQLVIHALDVMGVRFALNVALNWQYLCVGLVSVCAELNMARTRQLLS